jgi:hypothetical protein
MADLSLLIRLSRRAAEEQQLRLNQISQAHAQATAAVREHEDDIAAECEVAASDLHALAVFARWASDAGRRGGVLQQRRADLASSEVAAHGALHEAFIDMKRLELAFNAARDTAAYASRRRADVAADDREQIRRRAETV